jgi:NAD(P)-dependent dehydrogenase (short-subunit alcohol dehydrogenase family)
MSMEIKDSIVLVTGGNRGLGTYLVQAFLEAGAQKVYIGTRRPIELHDPRLQAVTLDVTHADDIAAAAETCQDVTILVNNAGVALYNTFVTPPASSMDQARKEMETNYFGTLSMVRAFAPILKKNGGGGIVNINSAAGWFPVSALATYSASKAATLMLTNGLRIELHSQGTFVTSVHVGFFESDMTVNTDIPKISPEYVASLTIEGILAGKEEIADPASLEQKAMLTANPQAFWQYLQAGWDAFVPGSWKPFEPQQ